jgi:hypothetical protein
VSPSPIHDWNSISSGFRDGLVLGNGASIAVDNRFRYSSLWEHAQTTSSVGADVQSVFSFLETSDFEFVLRALWHAQNINLALEIDEGRTRGAYESVRSALIAVVRAIHPAHADVSAALGRAQTFLGQFGMVASLNYDLLLYWAILMGNAAMPHRFKDCFLGGVFQQDWRRLRAPFGQATAATLVFYPHGNLALGSDLTGVESKISAEGGVLLDTVVAAWEAGTLTPVFVSEGTSAQKLRSIRHSPYLLKVFEDALPELGESITVFGWSMADQDDHLLPVLCRNRPRRLAISVRRDSPRLEENMARAKRKLDLHLEQNRYELFFFDAASSGAWVAA